MMKMDEEEKKFWWRIVIENLLVILACIIVGWLLSFLVSCTTTKYVEVEKEVVKHDTAYFAHNIHDSIYVHDSISIDIDSVGVQTVTRWKERYRYLTKTDTVYKSKTDTVVVSKEIEVPVKQESGSSSMKWGWIVGWMLLAGILTGGFFWLLHKMKII